MVSSLLATPALTNANSFILQQVAKAEMANIVTGLKVGTLIIGGGNIGYNLAKNQQYRHSHYWLCTTVQGL